MRAALVILMLAVCGRVHALDAAGAARAEVGSQVTFVDVIREVVVKPSGAVFLNFGKPYPREVLKVIIMPATRPRFPGVETWLGKKVRVWGTLTELSGHRRIILRERGQIVLAKQKKKPLIPVPG